jgi:hypothetical protein
MITYVSGNLFHSPAQVQVNTVNCAGVMGKGLALEFKQRYPEMFANYVARCGRFEVKPGVPYLWENDEVQILNFPTKLKKQSLHRAACAFSSHNKERLAFKSFHNAIFDQ